MTIVATWHRSRSPAVRENEKRPFRGVGPGMLSPAGNWIIDRPGAAVKGSSGWR